MKGELMRIKVVVIKNLRRLDCVEVKGSIGTWE